MSLSKSSSHFATLTPANQNPAETARVVGSKGFWSVFLRNAEGEWPLILGPNMRVFRHFESVVVQLKNRGIHEFQVDIQHEQTADKEVVISPLRPKVLKRAQGAEAYDAWFRNLISQCLKAPTAPLTAAEVERQMEVFKDQLVAVAP